MAIAFDNNTVSAPATQSTKTVTSYSVTSSSPGVFLNITQKTTLRTYNTVTYGGVAMTQIGTDVQQGTASYWLSMWYLAAPPSGANSIVVTLSGSTVFGFNFVGFSGCNQSSLIDTNTFTKSADSAGGYTASITSTVNNTLMYLANAASVDNYGAGTGATLIANNEEDTFYGSSVQASPGSYSMTLTAAHSTNHVAAIGVMIKPVAAVAQNNAPFFLNFV